MHEISSAFTMQCNALSLKEMGLEYYTNSWSEMLIKLANGIHTNYKQYISNFCSFAYSHTDTAELLYNSATICSRKVEGMATCMCTSTACACINALSTTTGRGTAAPVRVPVLPEPGGCPAGREATRGGKEGRRGQERGHPHHQEEEGRSQEEEGKLPLKKRAIN